MIHICKDFKEEVDMSKCTDEKCGMLFWVQAPFSGGRYINQTAYYCYCCGSRARKVTEEEWEEWEDYNRENEDE